MVSAGIHTKPAEEYWFWCAEVHSIKWARSVNLQGVEVPCFPHFNAKDLSSKYRIELEWKELLHEHTECYSHVVSSLWLF